VEQQTSEVRYPPRPGLPARPWAALWEKLKGREGSQYWDVSRVIAARDYKAKYKQSLLGPAWLLLQPALLLLGVLVAFKGTDATAPIPLVLFAASGLASWVFFQAAMIIGTASISGNWNLVRRTACPRLALPTGAVLASLPAFAVPCAVAIVIAAVNGQLSAKAFLLPVVLIWLLVLTVSFCLFTSAVTVYFRDLNSALPFLLQVGLFITPVAYPRTLLGEPLETVMLFNPLTGVIEASRWTIVGDASIDGGAIAIGLVLTAVAAIVGFFTFWRLEPMMADYI
jgi:lipopolysaccharide transport system permease protein